MEPLGPLREDEIFADMSRESDKNCATIANKGCEMAHSAVDNNTITPTSASNALANFFIKVSVSKIRPDSQRPSDAPLTTLGPTPFFLEESYVKMSNKFINM